MAGKNLASRVAGSIAKNSVKLNTDKAIHKIDFDALYPVGEVSIQNKSDKAPATSVRIIVKSYIECLLGKFWVYK